jgi:flagellar biosynthesis/type III secretory pathway chaperone
VSSLHDQLSTAHEQCANLRRLLDEEFESLRARDLDRFESLQTVKVVLLAELTTAVENQRRLLADHASDTELLSRWETFRASMLECRDLHRRNEILILRKRDAIEGALSALVGGFDSTASVEVYDRLGRMNRPRRRNAYAQA